MIGAAQVSGTASYTHTLCGSCGAVLMCSVAEPWHPQREYGWCPHGSEEDGGVQEVFMSRAGWHRCEP